ncbi:MAG: hypothetical protein ACOX9B_06560 [Candidatus Xenobium sp.]|jgi:hypothetical protein
MTLLAAPLVRILDAAERLAEGRATPAEVYDALSGARDFCAEGRALFALVSPGLLRTAEVDRILEECRQDLDAQEEALKALEEALKASEPSRVGWAAERLREAASRLARGYGLLHEEEKKEKIYSPFPAVEHFLKVGLNVLEGHVGRAELTERFPPVVALVGRLERDHQRFEALYGAEEVALPMVGLLEAMQAGLGAIAEYFESGSRSALADGLKLLGRGSAAAHELLPEMDRVAAATRRSGHAYLDELRRALDCHAEGRLPWMLVRDAWQLVRDAESHYRQELDAFRRFPLYPFMKDDELPARAALDQVQVELELLEPAFDRESTPDLAGLEPAFDELASQVAHLWDRIEEELGRYSEAPAFQELRERVGRALSGEPVDLLLRQQFSSFHETQQELLNQLAQGGLEGGLGSELGALLAVQDQAWQVLLSSLEGPDLAVLRRGWELLEATMPRMVEIARGMRQVLQKSRPAAPTGMACMRCGHANPPGVRYCGACSAVLPEVFQAPTEYTDILGGGASETGTRLSNMERLLTAYEVGQVEGEEVLAELVALEQMSEQVLRTLEQDEPRIQTDQEADFARRFRELANDDAQGLALLRKGLEEGDLSAAWQGLEVCRVAAQGVIGLKQEIDAVMNSEAG